MSFLTPLFLAGVLAVAGPVIFHLIRQTTRERMEFSSLMFLDPTPPRVTRRTRLDHILLLLLRCGVIGLVALAFARPFVRSSDLALGADGKQRRITVLVDRSASMRRADLWSLARQRVKRILDETGAKDQVALYAFDHGIRSVISFEDWRNEPATARTALALQRLEALPPSWGGSDLGGALVFAAESFDDRSAGTDAGGQGPFAGERKVVLIGDLQEGSRLEAMQAFEWPVEVELAVERLNLPVQPNNAGLQPVAPSALEAGDESAQLRPRVRVTNSADSHEERFQLGWAASNRPGVVSGSMDVYVPPGESRVLRLPAPPAGHPGREIRIQGDQHDFDNRVFRVPPRPETMNLVYHGSDSADSVGGPRFFLRLAFNDSRLRRFRWMDLVPVDGAPPSDLSSADLVVLTEPPPPDELERLKDFLETGRTLVAVLSNTNMASAMGSLVDVPALSARESDGDRFALLGSLDFEHPLLAPFADPRFSDFTRIQFWKHRVLDLAPLPRAHVVARFDDQTPALVEIPAGRGRILLFTTGWHRPDSQLALSSKFVPLLHSILHQSTGRGVLTAGFRVGDRVPAAFLGVDTESVTVTGPGGVETKVPAGEGFSATDEPGVYRVSNVAGRMDFAVNLDPAESLTAPLPEEELSGAGAVLEAPPREKAVREQQKRNLQATEIESRQQIWRWCLAIALLFLVFETWLSGRNQTQPQAA